MFYVFDGNVVFLVVVFLVCSVVSCSEVIGYVLFVVVGIGYLGDKDFDVEVCCCDYIVVIGKLG